MIKIIGVTIIFTIIALLVFAAMQPDSFRVQRSATIKASPEKVFAQINDFHRWDAWSPWEKVDPAVKRSYSGADNGKGAVYAWEGNSEIGQGRMEIIESIPSSKMLLKIEFIKPFAATNTVEFNLTQNGENTTVMQAMYGPSPFMSKLMGFFFSMEKNSGRQI